MKFFAQHGFGDGGKIDAGLSAEVIDGVLLSPRDISRESIMNRIEEVREANSAATILFDPQFYAALVGLLPDARMGKLSSDYREYFSPSQLRDIRRERRIAEIVDATHGFQKDHLGLDQYILPNILIQDGLQSESSGIAKSFLEISDEIAIDNGIADNTWLSLVLGSNCFRNEKRLENFVDEITGFALQSKGIYLLVEMSPSQGVCPWHTPELLSGVMYISYALSESGYNVINGYSFYSAPFLSITGSYACGSGWFDTLRCFSLNRFRPSVGGGRRPNRKYLSNTLWNRIGLQEFRTYRDGYPWLANNQAFESEFIKSSEEKRPNEKDECLQHWEAVKLISERLTASSDIHDKLLAALEWVVRQERARTQIPVLSLPFHDQQTRDCKAALHRFAEQAEVPLSR